MNKDLIEAIVITIVVAIATFCVVGIADNLVRLILIIVNN